MARKLESLGRSGRNIYLLIIGNVLCLLIGQIGGADDDMNNDILPPHPVASSFVKLIPQFNPNTFTVQFKTGTNLTKISNFIFNEFVEIIPDERIALSPTNPSFVSFLTQYATLALNEIERSSGSSAAGLRDQMLTFFKTEYGKFLSEVGVPVGCISVYSGATDMTTMKQLEALTESLNYESKEKGPSSSSRRKAMFGGLVANDLVQRLNLAFITRPFLRDTSIHAQVSTCDKIFWTCGWQILN